MHLLSYLKVKITGNQYKHDPWLLKYNFVHKYLPTVNMLESTVFDLLRSDTVNRCVHIWLKNPSRLQVSSMNATAYRPRLNW